MSEAITSSLSTRKNYPAIRIKTGEKISINKRTLYALGCPKNIQFWWSESEKALLISSASEKEPLSIPVNNYVYTTKNAMRIESVRYIKALLNITGLSGDVIYVIAGEYIPDLNMVAFKLMGAKQMRIYDNA